MWRRAACSTAASDSSAATDPTKDAAITTTIATAIAAALTSITITTTRALHAAETLAQSGIDCGVLHMHTVKPLDEEAILAAAGKVSAVVTVEEHTLVGGLGSAVSDLLSDRLGPQAPRLLRLGIPDRFPDKYGSQDELLSYYGLQGAQIAARVQSLVAGGREEAA